MERETTPDLLLTCHNLFLPQTFTNDIFDTKTFSEHRFTIFLALSFMYVHVLCDAFIFNCIILLYKTEGKFFHVDKNILLILRHVCIKLFQTC